jgi:hypothetical protein
MRRIAIIAPLIAATVGGVRRDIKLPNVEHDRLLDEYGHLYGRRSSMLKRMATLEWEMTVMRAVMIANGGVIGPGGTNPPRANGGVSEGISFASMQS